MSFKIGNKNPFAELKGPFADSPSDTLSLTKGGGVSGIIPDRNGYMQNALYLRRRILCFVLNTPLGFDYLGDKGEAAVWHSSLKAIMEVHSHSITGIQSGIELEYSQIDIHGDGGQISEAANATRAQSQPVHACRERRGKPIARTIDGWIELLIMDPLLKGPRIEILSDADISLMPDEQSMTCLYVEPSHNWRDVVEAWLVTDMKPLNGTVVEGSSDINASREVLEHSLAFTGWQQVGPNIRALGRQKLQEMLSSGVPDVGYEAPIMTEASPQVRAAKSGTTEEAQRLAAKFTRIGT